MESPKEKIITIANGQTASAAIKLEGRTLCGLFIPSAFTGTAITFEASRYAETTFISMFDGSGVAISKTVAQGQYIVLNPQDFAGINYIKVVSGSAEAAEREIALALKSLS